MSISSAYKFNRPTRRCAAADRPLQPGEVYYSVVFDDGDDFVRRDYAAENWKGMPDAGFGFWRRRMPEAGPKKLIPAPPEILIDVLQQMKRFPNRVETRYLLALTLLRRRQVKMLPSPDTSILRVCGLNDTESIDVQVCDIPAERREEVQTSLEELLYAEEDESFDDEETDDS